MTPVLAKMKITWHPVIIEVAPSGDMGFTYGPYQFSVPDELGRPIVVAHGHYMTVWVRQLDGSWKVKADMGAEDTGKP